MIIKTTRDFIRVLLAISIAWTQAVMAAPLGEKVPGVLTPEGTEVVHEGVTDLQGRARVWSFLHANGGTPSFRYGTLTAPNQVQWDAQPSSRLPGGPLPGTPVPSATDYSTIPRNRALVPVHTNGGVSERNSPGREYLPEFADKNKWRRLRAEYRERMQYRLETAQEFQRTAIRVVRDAANSEALNELARMSAGAADKARAGASKLGGIGVSFYIAIGFVAAYHLMRDHSNNPMAWDNYIQGLPWNDPVGAIALVGFIAGAAYFYKKMGNAGPNGGMIRTLPFFAGALLAGTFVSTSVTTMWANDEVKKCVKSKLHDKAACDAAGAWFMSSPEESGAVYEIANGYVPVAANVLAAGGIYLGVVQTMTFIANKFKIVDAIRSFSPTRSARGGGAAGVGLMVVHMALFLGAYQFSNSVFAVEKSVREHLVAEMGLFGHRYGHSLKDAEQKVFTEWTNLKKSNWKDPDLWDKVCYDPNRKYNVLYNCDAPDQLDLAGLFGRYSKLQASWRAIQMQETMGAYQQWLKKQGDFHELVDTSYKYYKFMLPLLATGTFKPEHLRLPVPTNNANIAKLNMDKTWGSLSTPRMQEFLLASMACGPEAEGYGARGWWQNTRRFLKDYVTGNSSPQTLIDNPTGSAVTFFPPRITKPLPGSNDTICEKIGGIMPDPFSPPRNVLSAPIYTASYVLPDYVGLHAYIKDHIRANVLSPELGDNFEQWWSNGVTANVLVLQNDLMKEYRTMLDSVYKKAVTRADYKWCEESPVKGIGLEKYQRRLMMNSDKCGPDATHRLGYGIFNNLRDELRTYLALLMDLYISNLSTMGGPITVSGGATVHPVSVDQVENILIPRASKLIQKFDSMLDQLKVVDPAQRKDTGALLEESIAAFNEFSDIINSGPPIFDSPERVIEHQGSLLIIPPRPIFQKRLAHILLDKCKNVFEDSLNYYNILTALDRNPPAQ